MAYIWMAIALLLACSLTTEARARRKFKKGRRCEKITVSSCGNFAYQRTKFPNPFTNITTQDETNNLTAFIPALTRLNCTATDPMPFLCSVYVPVCTPDLRTVIPPCREFCEKAVGSCPALMVAAYGIQWPSPLDCSNYPSKMGGQVCLSKLRYRTNKNKNAKEKGKKKKPKADETKCCKLGEITVGKNATCNLSDTIATTTQPKRYLKVLKLCKDFESKFNECCRKKAVKIQEREAKKKQKRKNKKAKKQQRKLAKKGKKAGKLQQKKAGKQQKRKQKKNERKQKKANRKQKKQNRKQNRKGKKNGRGE
ncbi:frizzled-5-like [Paramuricea clavata]|uniref:Frizzled-5-like n=1 Tax=Paramuricea clavata TaxID=317549 RepID=A0A7D9HL07_PARCT|nr:frizzled-5-like [Paramuricea clavata]